MRPILSLLIALAFAPSLALAQHPACAVDELHMEAPSAPASGAPSATLVIDYRGGDPMAGPARGVCLERSGRVEHIPSGTRREITVPASSTHLLPLRVGSRHIHVSMPAGSRVELHGAACVPFALEGPDLDTMTATGTHRAAESQLFLSGSRLVPAQQGWCSPTIVVAGDREHTFYLRGGETGRIDVVGHDVRASRFDPASLHR